MQAPHLRVLIIDDNEAHCTGLAELLELRGFETQCAFTGADGLALASARIPNAVLLDMTLPDISGEDVCCTMRSDPRFSETAIIFHTGKQASGSTHRADAFLTYPVQIDNLVMVILGRIKHRRSDK